MKRAFLRTSLALLPIFLTASGSLAQDSAEPTEQGNDFSNEAPKAPVPSGFPISAEATEEQQLLFADTIRRSREEDVNVTPSNALLYHGLMLLQEEEYEESVPFLEEAIRRDPSVQAGWEGLGWAHIKLDHPQKADRLWRYFQRLMPDKALPYSLLAQSALLKTDWEEVDRNFKKSLEIDPEQYDVRYWYAQNLMRIGKIDEAEDIFRKLAEQDPDRLDVQLNLASLLANRFGQEEAVEIYRRVNSELPDNPKLMLEQAALELRTGDLRAADALCLDVLELDPENTDAIRLRADIAEIDGQQDIAPLLEVIKQTQNLRARADVRIRLANRCHLANERGTARYSTAFILSQIRKAISEVPENVEYRVLYAERLLQANRVEECGSWAREILEKLNPNHIRAKQLLFELALRQRRFDDALQILDSTYRNFDPNDPLYYFYQARLLCAQGEYAKALTAVDLFEAGARQSCVLTLGYSDLTESDWTPAVSVRRLGEHLRALRDEGFTIVSPTELKKLLALKPGETLKPAEKEEVSEVPATARAIDWLGWTVTGKRRFPKPETLIQREPTPPKYVCVTFENGLRSSLVLGSNVAEDFGVQFGIFNPAAPEKEYQPSRTGWEELREHAKSGSWVVGSQLLESNFDKAVDSEGLDIRRALINRLWVEKKHRLESMNEWDARMRREFRNSRAVLSKELGENDSEISLVLYPYGNISQESSCNLSLLRSPAQSIIAQAARNYSLGFIIVLDLLKSV